MAWPKSPVAWLGLAVLSFLCLGPVFFVGIFAAGKDIDETCAAAGQTYDRVYRHLNWREPGQLYPLHNKCNAEYDTVPFWVNPVLAILAILTVVFLGLSIRAAMRRRSSHMPSVPRS
ncbi:hypothetical protein Achl_4311 (plasmid) [Pseudarthrobacter chlorophenolicus A6]|uniref:Integral membrane protein n=1 Tax=Pseudarthrobacter chlorophenolicus (strain ATCC 700700 / DSM 12829 / CIP 107037 / JCM 12360 / KCTC 9906 / NCIMB 13794 / A6) TaxID=452863 RepID=B8HIL5_PSECP|nr:hypothetical protein [Pseudarthrobacter chlorophenolicus]ACL42262.1 hypothetical protein Achl_4311 [Pseudarthrobacter chlorophenolicus A6]SDQ15618.1 hypothetical protein SAMN04489738_0369 [Pseudarthrobacter chlorophenolicus]